MSVLRSSSAAVLRTVWRGYKSEVSLERLYPARQTVKVTPPDLGSAKFTGHIAMSDLTTSYSDTAVDIR